MTLPAAAQPARAATRRSLEDLFSEAETYGALTVSRMDSTPGHLVRYWARIYFNTIPGVNLRADGQITDGPHETIEQAIAKAKQIAGQFR